MKRVLKKAVGGIVRPFVAYAMARNLKDNPWDGERFVQSAPEEKAVLFQSAEMVDCRIETQQALADAPMISSQLRSYEVKSAYYRVVRSARVIRNIASSGNGDVFCELLSEIPIRPDRPVGIRFRDLVRCTYPRLFPAKRRIAKGFLISPACWRNYFHFLMDVVVPYANLLEETGESWREHSLIADQPLTPWQETLLKLIGCDIASQLKCINARITEVDELLLLSKRRINIHQYSRKALQNTRNRVFRCLPPHSSRNRLLYISRRQARSRRLENENELLDLLIPLGFEVLLLENMQVEEQIKAFAEAQIIVAPHGAGLANLLFANAPSVIELLPREEGLAFFANLTLILGGEYFPVLSTEPERKRTFRINLEQVLQRVEHCIVQGANTNPVLSNSSSG